MLDIRAALPETGRRASKAGVILQGAARAVAFAAEDFGRRRASDMRSHSTAWQVAFRFSPEHPRNRALDFGL